MAMHKKAQSALSDIEEFFGKKMDGKEKDISDIVEMGSVENEDTTSTQVGGDKSIKQMLQDIMVKLEPVFGHCIQVYWKSKLVTDTVNIG